MYSPPELNFKFPYCNDMLNAYRRSLNSHWIVYIVGPATLYVFAISVNMKLMTASCTHMLGFAWVSALCLTVGLANMVWTTGLDVAVLRFFRSRRVAPQPETPPDNTAEGNSMAFIFSDDKAPDIPEQPPKSRLSGVAVSSKASFKQRQLQILINMCVVLLGTPTSSWVTVGALWFAKLVSLVMVLLTNDPTYTTDELKLVEPGFGMLVDAHHFRAALQAFLAGSTYTGPLGNTRGSYYCMDDALAVSYRCGSLAWLCPSIMPTVCLECFSVCLRPVEWRLTSLVNYEPGLTVLNVVDVGVFQVAG